MKMSLVKVIIAVLTLSLLLVGCGSQQTKPADGQKKLVFGMIVKDISTPYIQAFIQGAEKKAQELGVEIVIKDGQGDSDKIMSIMDNFITQNVDGFIMAGAVDLKAIVPGVKRLNEAKIPVMALDTSPEGGKVDLFISFDIKDASKKAAEAFVQGIKDRNGGNVPQGIVVEITGDLRDMFTKECSSGFKSVIDQYPQLTIVQGEGKWNNTDSNDRTSDLLTRYGKEIRGIYVQTPDIMGIGVVSAIEAAGLQAQDFGIAGICIGPEGIDLIKNKKVLAIVEQPAKDSAELAVQYLYNIKTNKPIPKIGDTVEQKDALWAPAKVVKNPFVDEGAYIILKGSLVPLEVKVDDPRLWENQLKK